MKMIFVLKQTAPNVEALSQDFLESFARGVKRMVGNDEIPLISLPYGFELQVIKLDGEGPEEVTVRYEDANGNEIARPARWK